MRQPNATARLPLTAVWAAALAVALSGCNPLVQPACPAIGWINSIDVRPTGPVEDVEGVAWVELCDDRGCSTSEQQPQASQHPDPGAVPGTEPPFYRATPEGRGRWTVSIGMAAPDTVTVRAYARDSTVLGESTVNPTWDRVGGSEECGGPVVTGPVELPLDDEGGRHDGDAA